MIKNTCSRDIWGLNQALNIPYYHLSHNFLSWKREKNNMYGFLMRLTLIVFLSWGQFFPSKGHVAMMEDILSIATWEKVLLASNGEGTRTMLKVLQHPRGQHMCVLSHSACLTLCDPMNCSSPGSSICEMSQERKVEWVAIFSSRASSQRRDQTEVSCIGRWVLYCWASREAQ